MTDIYCDECGSQFRNTCHCEPQPPVSEKQERWVGADGHEYIGDPNRSSLAMHTSSCACHNPEEWF